MFTATVRIIIIFLRTIRSIFYFIIQYINYCIYDKLTFKPLFTNLKKFTFLQGKLYYKNKLINLYH